MSSSVFMGWTMPERFLLPPTPTTDAIKGRLLQRKRDEERRRRERTCKETTPRKTTHVDISSQQPAAAVKEKKVTGGKRTIAEGTSRSQHGPEEVCEEVEVTAPLTRLLRRQKKTKRCTRSSCRTENKQRDAEHLQAPARTLHLPPLITTHLPMPREKRPAFHHLRLLTPRTRSNKTLYQTWHGRPILNDHWSMFTTSHRGHALEYLIHPDWS
ncbi:uncharacterized protein LOC115466094 [Microcaecilia unicolor]|uniref:Uncharacterized protein LOC115466094 n=1 Tax=Microcaecilia unicolor TaxID=1415580 RepID=A0A6P7XQP0_9AMPH|nr:uncharacterized protein LOC115466094 [Microcaecilia unicolor]